jgi:hypothetical protein
MSKHEFIRETIDNEAVNETPVVEKAAPVQRNGIVTGCSALNIRKRPNMKADVVCVVKADDVLIIDDKMSSSEWLKVVTEDGKYGYCMAKYVE